jgi:hypothetical protein
MALFKTAWDAQGGTIPLVFYQDTVTDIPKDGSAWAKISVLHQNGGQATLGEVGNRTFRREGLVIVEIHSPFGEGLANGDLLSKVALDAFEGNTTASGEIWFRNARLSEIGQDGDWHISTVMVDFEYDEIK